MFLLLFMCNAIQPLQGRYRSVLGLHQGVVQIKALRPFSSVSNLMSLLRDEIRHHNNLIMKQSNSQNSTKCRSVFADRGKDNREQQDYY